MSFVTESTQPLAYRLYANLNTHSMKSFREQYYEKKRLDEIQRTGIDGYCICCGAPDYVDSGQQHDESCIWFEPIEKQNSPPELT